MGFFAPNKSHPEILRNRAYVSKVAENQTELWYLGDQVCYLNIHITTDILQPLGVETEQYYINSDGNQMYTYTDHLLALEASRPVVPRPTPMVGTIITSPLIVDNWRQALRDHPDKRFVQYLLEGLAHGFHIGFNPDQHCTPCKSNMKSAYENPQPVDNYLQTELAAGRIVGPFYRTN